eukprot:5720817-Prymnesium_polylepis.1
MTSPGTHINVFLHSLLFSLYSFIDEHDGHRHTTDIKWTSNDRVISEAAHDWVWSANDGIVKLGKGQMGPSEVSRKRPSAVPYELPAELAQRIRDDSNSPLAHDYRLWVRSEWEPAVRRIADLIREWNDVRIHTRAYAAIGSLAPDRLPTAGNGPGRMEPVPAERLREIFDEPPIRFRD